jgi:ABC-2 type transport system permease protein
MRELWLVAQGEYRNRVRQRSFLLGILAVPLLIIVSTGVAVLVSLGGGDNRPLGYVDRSGVLAAAVVPPPEEGEEPLEVRAYADPAAAQAALEAGEIQAYYVLPPDYLQTRTVSLYYLDRGPGVALQNQFRRFIRANLLVGQSLGARDWALEGPELTIISADGTRDWSISNIVNVIVPFAAGLFFFFAVMGSSGYMLGAVTDEKENYTIEIMVTSMTPEQLVGGKALGLMGVALTQVAIWVAVAAGALLIAAPHVPFLGNLQVPWGLLAVFGLYFLPSFALVSGLMIAIGGAVADHRQGQQIAGILNMFFVLPMLLSAIVFINPDSPVLVVLTLFPTTAMLTIMLRWGMTILPFWQLAGSWLLLVAAAGLSVWAAARIFRLGMLRYGQGLGLREALAGLRARRGRAV